jgi:hypothetical protein
MAAAVGSNTWITKAAYPRDIWGPTSAPITNPTTLRTIVYVIGGRQRLYGYNNPTSVVRAYDASANTWRKLAPYPRGVRHTNGAQVIGGKVYVSGGVSRYWDAAAGRYFIEILAALYVYDPARNLWTRKRNMPIATAAGVSGVYRDKLYVATDCYATSICSSEYPGDTRGVLLRYAPSTDRWSVLTRTPIEWSEGGTAGGFIGGKFYLVAALGTTYVYDPATNTWSTTGATRPTRHCAPGYTTFQAKLYLVGCSEDGDLSGVYPMLVYDPVTNAWTRRAASQRSAAEHADDRTLSRVRLPNGQARLELIGGAWPNNNLQYIP